MTAASTRASRKPKSKTSERKWCTCQERCKGGKEVAASTYRTHNPTGRDGAVGSVGNKRKVVPDDEGGVHLESGVRETRRMRARRVAEGGGELTGTFGLGCVQARLQERGMHEHSEARIRGYAEGNDVKEDDNESTGTPCVEVYYPVQNAMEIDEDHGEDDHLRATLHAVNEMVSTILSWD